MSERAPPMLRKAFRFPQEDLARLSLMAQFAGLSDSEKLRDLIKSAAGDLPLSGSRKLKKVRSHPPLPVITSLDPDTRLILIRACNLLNQIAKSLHVIRLRGSTLEVACLSAQLLEVENDLLDVGKRQVAIANMMGASK